MRGYIEWINSCKIIITSDSFGLHVAHALGKKTISLFGPTNSNEIYIDNGIKIQKESMKQISPDEVMKAIEKLM